MKVGKDEEKKNIGLMLDFSINFWVFAHFVCLEGAYVGPV